MSAIWFSIMAIALIVAAINGKIGAFTTGALEGAESAVKLAIGLVGAMALWLGVVRVAEEAGLVALLARLVRPIMQRLFPEVPSDHPALSAMTLNIGANILGLGNAATPLGIKAMEELQSLNSRKDTASDAMVLFLAINTSSVQLIPATVIALRASEGSKDPTDIVGPALIATLCSTIVGIFMAKLLARTRLARTGLITPGGQ